MSGLVIFLKKTISILTQIIAFICKYFLLLFAIIVVSTIVFFYKTTKDLNKDFSTFFQNKTIIIQDEHEEKKSGEECENIDNLRKQTAQIARNFISFTGKIINGGNASKEITELCEFFNCDKTKILDIQAFEGSEKISQTLQKIAFKEKSQSGVIIKSKTIKKHIQIIKKTTSADAFTKSTTPQNLILASNFVRQLNYEKASEILTKIIEIKDINQDTLDQLSRIHREIIIINDINDSINQDNLTQ